MAPENAKVFIAEDNSSSNKTFVRQLEKAGHTVVGNTNHFWHTDRELDQVEELDVALIDGNLGGGSGDGTKTANKIKQKFPNAKLICVASHVGECDDEWADGYLGKDNIHLTGETVTKI